jgi:hypothetical protein
MSQARRSNQERAPLCAAFVENLRGVFGEVKVLHVQEGALTIGAPTEGWVPITVGVIELRAANDGAL